MIKLICFMLVVFLSSPVYASEILFTGDITLTKNISPNQTNFFSEEVKNLINSSDMLVYNVEFSGKSNSLKKKQFVFSCDSDILQYINFPNSVGLVTNNHSFDGNEIGFRNLIASLDKFKMKHIGLKSQKYLKYKNFYILGYSPMISSPLVNSFEDVISVIKQIQKKLGEFIIVCIHDGIEKAYAPSSRQIAQTKFLASLGVDIICYTHSHTYIDPSKIGDTLVLWGMGNFIFGGNSGWRNKSDVRMMSVNPESKTWKWIKGRTKNYIFEK